MKILLAAAELTPLARTSGLGDVLAALPAALENDGHEVSVVLPCYRGLRTDPQLRATFTGVRITVPLGTQQRTAEIFQGIAPSGAQIFLVREDFYFDRAELFDADGRAFEDNAERFIFFSKVIVELARRLVPPPDLIHVHEWQTALVPVLIKERRLPFKTVLSIHQAAEQGAFWAFDFQLTNLPGHYFSASGVEFYGALNLLKGGLLFADQLLAPSQRAALAFQTPEHASGLAAVFQENAGKLTGIMSGIDAPKADASDELSEKAAARDALLAACELALQPHGPVFAMDLRILAPDGLALLLPLLDRLLADDVRLVVCGPSAGAAERELLIASKRHHCRFAWRETADEALAQLLTTGADLALIPAEFELSGNSARASLHAGTLPIAWASAGISEVIEDGDAALESGNGFLFHSKNPEALWDAIVRARQLFTDRERWPVLVRRAMAVDVSWSRTAQQYTELYQRETGRR